MSNQSLKDKTIRGTFWSAADAFLGHGITFIVGIVLARLLSPDEYGLVGICLIFNTILNGIVDSGFSNALIRKKECNNDDYNTMFITNLVISMVLYMFLFFSSYLIADFFCRLELRSLIRVTGLVIFFNAFSLVQQTILTKRIDFKTKTKASIVSAVFSGIVGMYMAYMRFGAWALVGQMISKQFIYTVCLWILNRWWPTLSFNIQSFRYMWGFGWKLLASGLLNNIWNQLYQVVVGKFYSPATLGQYTRGHQFAAIFSENLTVIIQRVSYPVLSNIQDNRDRMVAGYRQVIKLTMFVTIIVMFSLAAVSESLLYVLIGEKWHEAATYLPLICISLTLYPLHAINLNMLQVLGRSDIFLYLEIAKKIIAIVPLVIGICVSVYWMLVSSVFTGIIAFFLNSWYTGHKLGYTSFRQFLDIVPSIIVGLAIAIPVYSIKYLTLDWGIILTIQVFLGVIVFFVICELTRNTEYLEIIKIIKRFFSRDRK